MALVFSAAVVLATVRRYVVVSRAAAARRGILTRAGQPCRCVGGVDLDLSALHRRTTLLRTAVAVAAQVNPITKHHHVVWWDKPPAADALGRRRVAHSRGTFTDHDDVTDDPAGQGLAAIRPDDRLAFFNTVREVQWALTAKTGCTDFNISWQEGCGHPVPGGFKSWARYVHVVPRLKGDLKGDAVHKMLEEWTWQANIPPNLSLIHI